MKKVIMVAETGINHNGDIGIAKQLIDVAKFANVDYVKFQKRDINLVYSEKELDVSRESPWGTTNRQQKEGLEFNLGDYIAIDDHCRQIGMRWYGSPWDIKSVDFLVQFKPDYLKIASALITYKELLVKIKETGIPLVVSTGMSNPDEINEVCNFFGDQISYLLHCTSTYPCLPEEINMNCILELKEIYPQYKIGFSNHSSGTVYIPVAVGLGAEMVEFHVTLDRSMYGSDQPASIEPEGVLKISKYVRNLEVAMGDGVKKVYDSELPILKKLRRL